MSDEISEIELVSLISEEIYNEYVVALEFLNHNPDYSLLKFRLIVETILNELATFKKIEFEDGSVFKKIEYLFDAQIINKDFKDNFHSIRKLCNGGVHKKIDFSASDLSEKEFYEENKKQLIKNSQEVRKKLNLIFIDYLNVVKPNLKTNIKNINFLDIKEKEYKDLIFQACTQENFRKKIQAGVVCENIKKELQLSKGLVVTSSFGAHLDSLDNMAINFYDAACYISANFDKNLIKLNGNKEKTIQVYSNVEAMHKFSSIVLGGEASKKQKEIAWNRLKSAADRLYAPAQGEYGAYLYSDEKDYLNAIKYLTEAEKKDDFLALRFLFYYYKDGLACEMNIEQAKKYLMKAVDLGYPDSLAMLGIEYHKGIIYQKDDNKAREYLENSIQQGSCIGRRYYMIEFNDIKGKMLEGFKEIADIFEKIANESKKNPVKNITEKIGRNDQCSCGSGKKFKKCCGFNNEKIKQSITNFYQINLR